MKKKKKKKRWGQGAKIKIITTQREKGFRQNQDKGKKYTEPDRSSYRARSNPP